MANCGNCAGGLRQARGRHAYVEGGLPFIMLLNVVLLQCVACAGTIAVLPDARLLTAPIAEALLLLRAKLPGAAIRYLRKAMSMTADELAFLLGSTRIQVSRWENDHVKMNGVTELKFRTEVADKLLPAAATDASRIKNQIVEIVTRGLEDTPMSQITIDAAPYYVQPFDLPPIESRTRVAK